jgi:mRNA-degrading endonuclease RelE of RelBE toxin-antitoxin system
MPLSLIALPRFLKQYKKLYSKVQDSVEEQVKFILNNPLAGEKKTGDISFMRVHKFKVGTQLYLLAYRVDDKASKLYLYAVGTHENFYRDLKKYITHA